MSNLINEHDDLVKKTEFEDFAKNLNDKTDKISERLLDHDKRIEFLSNSVDKLVIGMEYIDKTIATGLNNIEKRIDDISLYLSKETDTIKEYNTNENIRREKELKEHIDESKDCIDIYITENKEDIDNLKIQLNDISKEFDSEIKDKKEFWSTNFATAATIVIALIQILPLIFNSLFSK